MSRKHPGEIHSSETPNKQVDDTKIEIKSFSPEPIPVMPELFRKRFDDAELILKSGTAPILILKSKDRDRAVCSAMVQRFIVSHYGRDNLASLLNLTEVKNTPRLNAWDFKREGLRTGELKVAASSIDSLSYSMKDSPDKSSMSIKDEVKYLKSMKDVLSRPGIVLIYYQGSRYQTDVDRSIRSSMSKQAQKDKEMGLDATTQNLNLESVKRTFSYNSHIGFNLGMKEIEKSIDIDSDGFTLDEFLDDTAPYLLQKGNPYSLKVYNGQGIEIDFTPNFRLRRGDSITYLEPQILHFIGGKEVIDGAFDFASSSTQADEHLFLDRLEPSHPTPGLDYSIESENYLQLATMEKDKIKIYDHVSTLLKEKLDLPHPEIESYLVALEVIGLPVTRITPTTIIPVLSMKQVDEILQVGTDSEITSTGNAKAKLKLILDNERSLVGAVILPGSKPMQHFQFVFDLIQSDNPQLHPYEKILILKMIDQSVQSIDIDKGRFNANTITTISFQRVSEISLEIEKLRSRRFEDITSPVIKSASEAFAFLNYFLDLVSEEPVSDSLHDFERIDLLQLFDREFTYDRIADGSYTITLNITYLKELSRDIVKIKDHDFELVSPSFEIYGEDEILDLKPSRAMQHAVSLVTGDNLMKTLILGSHTLEVQRPGLIRPFLKVIGRQMNHIESGVALQTRASIGNLEQIAAYYAEFSASENPWVQEVIHEIESKPLLMKFINGKDTISKSLQLIHLGINKLTADTLKLSNNPEYSTSFIQFDNAVREYLDFPVEPDKWDKASKAFETHTRQMSRLLSDIQYLELTDNPILDIVKSSQFQNAMTGKFDYEMDKKTLYYTFMTCIRIFSNPTLDLAVKSHRISAYSALIEKQTKLNIEYKTQKSQFLEIITDSEIISSVIAYKNFQHDLDFLTNIAFVYNQEFNPTQDWEAFRMLLTCHNRGVGNVMMSILENISYHLYLDLIGEQKNPELILKGDIDSLKNPQRMGLNKIKIYRTIKVLASQLRDQGKLSSQWTDKKIEEDAGLVLRSGGVKALLESELMRELNKLYFSKYESVPFVFTGIHMHDLVFSYGGKLIRSEEDFHKVKFYNIHF